MDLVRAFRLEADPVPKEGVLRGDAVHPLLCSDPGIVVLEAQVLGSIGQALQLPSILPGIDPAVIGQGIAYGIIGDCLAVVGGQLVLPAGVPIGIGNSGKLCSQYAVGVGVFLLGQEVPTCIVGVCDGLACVSIVFPDDFVQLIVVVLCELRPVRQGLDVPVLVVGIGDGASIVSHGGHSGRGGSVPDCVSIEKRSPEAASRSRIGDWEGDTVAGKWRMGCFMTLVDRKTRFLVSRTSRRPSGNRSAAACKGCPACP